MVVVGIALLKSVAEEVQVVPAIVVAAEDLLESGLAVAEVGGVICSMILDVLVVVLWEGIVFLHVDCSEVHDINSCRRCVWWVLSSKKYEK